MNSLLWPLVGGTLAMIVVMFLAWLWQRYSGNAGVVDVAWTAGVGVMALVFVGFFADGLAVRRGLVAVLAGCWSLRLSSHLLARVLYHAEDERYRRLKAEWGPWAQLRLLLFYQSQALVAPLFALPMLLAGRSTAPLNIWDAVGVAMGSFALWGEFQADRQLAQFRSEPANRGKVCQVGWWRFSRHPNYFFEWLYWCSFVPLAIYAPWGWLAAVAPLAIFYFLYFVTGIPPAEAQALASRGDAYREYQRTTSSFFPWPW